jgi:ABC-2 type transport system permease protein
MLGTWIERRSWPVAPEGTLTIGAFSGMFGAFALFAWCATLFWIGFAFWFHDLPRAGNLSAAIVVGALYSLAIAALGVCLGCWMADRERPFQLIGATSVPLLFLSGFAFPTVESLPWPLRWLSEALPTTHGIQAMLKLNQMGASWHEIAPDVVRLLLVTVVYAGLAWWLAVGKARAATVRKE